MSSRWGPAKKDVDIEDNNKEAADNETETTATAGASESKPTVVAQHHSDDAASNDYELIDEVEWGPRRDEDGYDTDQELASKPRRKPAGEDLCGCFPPATTGFACVDESCVLYACREECRSNCLAGSLCGNKRIQRKEFCDVEVFDAGSKGKGLRLSNGTKAAMKGDILCEYLGRAIREKALNRLFRRYQLDRRLYIMSLGDGVYLDARQKGGIARYINHSCKPNCKVELWTVRGVVRAAVVSMCEIAPGEELTFDYQWERKRGRAPTVCYCGTPECRGTLEVSKSLEEQDLQRQGRWEQVPQGQLADQTYVNRTVQIFSKEHKEYFLGEVTGFDGEKGLHCIFYRQAKTEVWEDLSKEDWMVLNDAVDKEHFIIAKKVSLRRASTPTMPLLTSSSSDKFGQGMQNQGCKNYVYVQTPIKETLWSMHLIERCERNCSVQIVAEQMSRPPLPAETEEDTEKYALLDLSRDGTVWKLNITGDDIPRAYTILRKNVNFIEKKLTSDETSRSARSTPTAQLKSFDSDSLPITSACLNEVAFPRIIEDVVKRKLQIVRDKCRNVAFTYAMSDNQATHFSILLLEGTSTADIASAREHLWQLLLEACAECNAPMNRNKMFCYNGFLGGILSGEQYELLLAGNVSRINPNHATNIKQRTNAFDDFNRLPFLKSFENTHRCVVWIQAHDVGQARIDSPEKAKIESTTVQSRKVFIGCKPTEVSRLFAIIRSHIDEVAKGAKFINLESDGVFIKHMKQDGGKLFEMVRHITGATVSVDLMTGDQLKVDLSQVKSEAQSDSLHILDDQARLANELVRLQIQCYRDESIREQSVLFGRDWTINACDFDDIVGSSAKVAVTSKLDRRSVSQFGMEIAEIVAKLNLEVSVAGHAVTILYRFVYAKPMVSTQLKIREALLASIYLANKTQKLTKWKRLDAVVQCGYEILYSGAKFDKSSEEVSNLEESILVAENEILETLQYDIFWCDIELLMITCAGAGKMKREFIQTVLEFTFSGPVLGAGAELWLKYGVKYLFAASAALLKAHLQALVPALSLDPRKVSSAAQLLVEMAKYSRPISDTKLSNPLLENISGKKKLLQYLPSIRDKCSKIKMESLITEIPVDATPTEKRFKLISKETRQCYAICGIDGALIQQSILAFIDAIEVESACRIYLHYVSACAKYDLLLFGSWRSIAVADNLLRSKLEGATTLPSTVVVLAKQHIRPNEPAKLLPGLLDFDDMHVDTGWLGTAQLEPSSRKEGGKFCCAAKLPNTSLRKAGLGWWNTPSFARSISGTISDMFTILQDPGNKNGRIVDLVSAMTLDTSEYPIIAQPKLSLSATSSQFKAVSFQRWPPEKVESREKRSLGKSKISPKYIGFSPAALQEMQLMKQIHDAIPSPYGHPNFMIPVGISVSSKNRKASVTDDSTSNGIASTDSLLDDPIISLFHSPGSEGFMSDGAIGSSNGSAYVVFSPTPFVLNRFISRKMRTSDDSPLIGDTILAAWFHDVLSGLVHCHENHILLRTVSSDQIFVGHSGVAMFGALYRCSVIPVSDRSRIKDPLESLKSTKDKKKSKDSDSDILDDPFAAPEILLGSPVHSKASDVWSVGSLLASLLLNKPIFSGKDRESLLTSQYKIVGTPSTDNFGDGSAYPNYAKPIKKYKRGVNKALEHLLKEKTPQYQKAIDLISRMLHLDPKKRCSAVAALGHEYMSEYSENCQSDAFRKQYAIEWINLKRRLLYQSTDDPDEQSRKRDAMIRSVSTRTAGGDDDDLYNLDDLLDHPSSPNKRVKFED